MYFFILVCWNCAGHLFHLLNNLLFELPFAASKGLGIVGNCEPVWQPGVQGQGQASPQVLFAFLSGSPECGMSKEDCIPRDSFVQTSIIRLYGAFCKHYGHRTILCVNWRQLFAQKHYEKKEISLQARFFFLKLMVP